MPSSDLCVSIAQGADRAAWENYIGRAGAATVFHRWAWRTAIESAYAHQPFFLIARNREASEIRGVLPLFLMRRPLFGPILASSPFASYGAICAEDAAAEQALLNEAIRIARELDVTYLELKSTCEAPCDELQRHSDYLNYQIQLDDPEKIWRSRFEKATREAIRQAGRFGLLMERGHHLLSEFYALMAINMRKLGTPVHSRAFYQSILASYQSDAELYLVRHDRQAAAVLLLLRFRASSCALYAASHPDLRKYRANNFMYWEVLKAEHTRGARRLDLGRSLKESGHSHFKRSLGATAQPLYYEYFLHRAKRIPRIRQGNRSLALATRAWSWLPLRLTMGLGPHLIKHVP